MASPLRLRSIPDLRVLTGQWVERLIDLDDYVISRPQPEQPVLFTLRSEVRGIGLYLDTGNRLTAGASNRPMNATFTVVAHQGGETARQTVRLKRSSFMLKPFVWLPPKALAPGERWTTPGSLYDLVVPADFPRERIGFECLTPYPSGIQAAGVRPDGRVWLQAGELPSQTVGALRIIARLQEPTPTGLPAPSPTAHPQTPTPTPQPTQTPTVAPTATPALQLAIDACEAEARFALTQRLPAGANPYNLASRDINQDGRPDFLIANYGDDFATLFTSDDNAAYQQTELPGDEGVLDALFVNGLIEDGTQAVLLGGYDSEISVYQQNAEGDWRRAVHWTLPELIWLPEERLLRARLNYLAAGHFLSAGRTQLAVVLPQRLLIYGINETNAPVLLFEAPLGFDIMQLQAADLNQDGIDELIIGHQAPEGVTTLSMAGGALQLLETYPLSQGFQGNSPQALTLSEIDGDGVPDPAVITFNKTIHYRHSQKRQWFVYQEPINMVVNDLTPLALHADQPPRLLLSGWNIQAQQAALAVICPQPDGRYTRHHATPIARAFPLDQWFLLRTLPRAREPAFIMLDRSAGALLRFRLQPP